MRKLSDDCRKKILELYKTLPSTEVGEIMGISYRTVLRIAREEGQAKGKGIKRFEHTCSKCHKFFLSRFKNMSGLCRLCGVSTWKQNRKKCGKCSLRLSIFPELRSKIIPTLCEGCDGSKEEVEDSAYQSPQEAHSVYFV